jgi:tRNA (cmo5U34)-methyltransferase
MNKDEVYALPRHRIGDFEFDESVASVFPDMISRSVPGYASVLSMIEQLTIRFARPNTNLYDLGCSLGAGTRLMRKQAPSSCTIHAIDNSAAMIDRLRQLLNDDTNKRCAIELHHVDLMEANIESASFVIFNWTLQFIAASKRQDLMQRIFDGMLPGGAILLSEKVKFTQATENDLLIDLHHDFKRANGYSNLEIAQKRTALENTLIPETIDDHLNRLKSVGFATATVWFQCFNFASFLAVKR